MGGGVSTRQSTTNNPSSNHPLLAYWTLSEIDPGTNNDLNYHRVPVPSENRHLGQWASIRGSGAGFPQRSKEYKAVLQNDLLQNPDEGVNYFKNTLKKYFLKGATNVYLYRLFSFFNHRRQNQEFLIFTSKIEILLMRLKAAWMDLMPGFTAQSPSFRQSVQDANARTIARHQRAAGVRAPPPALLNEDDSTVLRQTHFPSGIISLHSFSDFKVSCQINKEKDSQVQCH